MNYSKDYFKKETIDGFEVSAMMKCCRAAQMEVLEQFDEICRRHSIRYFLGYGTLLGAVRHKGFIPWDDDIDIWMLRGDRDRFIDEAVTELSAAGLEFVSPHNDPTYNNLAFRLINTRNYCLKEDFLKKYHMFPFMAGLDIFTLSYVPRDEKQLKDLCTVMVSANVLAQEWVKPETPLKEKMEAYEQLRSMLGFEPVEEKQIPNQLWRLTDLLGGSYDEEDADMVAEWSYYTQSPHKIFNKEWFAESICMEFEGVKLPCPKNYAEILTAEFGDDYMTPKMMPGDHEYPYYKSEHARMLRDLEGIGIACPEIYKSI